MHLVNIFTGSGSALKGLRLFVDLPSGVMGIGGGWGGGNFSNPNWKQAVWCEVYFPPPHPVEMDTADVFID